MVLLNLSPNPFVTSHPAFNRYYEYMEKAHQMGITGILMSGTLMFLTSQTLPTHSPLLQPHMDMQHLPAEVKLRVKREITFLNVSRLSM